MTIGCFRDGVHGRGPSGPARRAKSGKAGVEFLGLTS